MTRKRMWSFASLALLAACDQSGSRQSDQTQPGVWWEGYLVELAGAPVKSGIRIQIESDTPQGVIAYRLDTGCQGGGLVNAAGEVQAAETLRICDEADIARIDQLNRLSYFAGRQTPPLKATLKWDNRTATLSSELGSARFENSTLR